MLDGVGENEFDKNVEIVLIDLIEVSELQCYDSMMAEWGRASGFPFRMVLQRFESHNLPQGVLHFFQKLPIFKSLYLFCATFRHFRTFSIQFCLLQRAPKLKLIHLLLPAQFYIFLYKIGQK